MAKTAFKRKSANKVGRVKRTLEWLKPTSPAKGLVLFAFVFAAAGGGFYAYKSSAAGLTFDANNASWNLRGNKVVTDYHGSKKNNPAIRIPSRQYVTVNVNFNWPRDQGIFFCVSLRSGIPSDPGKYEAGLLLSDSGNGSAVFATTMNFYKKIPMDQVYREYCSGETIKAGQRTVSINVWNFEPNTADIYVAYLAMRW